MNIFPVNILTTFPPNYVDYSSEYFFGATLEIFSKEYSTAFYIFKSNKLSLKETFFLRVRNHFETRLINIICQVIFNSYDQNQVA